MFDNMMDGGLSSALGERLPYDNTMSTTQRKSNKYYPLSTVTRVALLPSSPMYFLTL